MPTLGANLFTYYQKVREKLTDVYQGDADSKWTVPRVVMGLNEAQRWLQRELRIASREGTRTLDSGTYVYDLPMGLMGRMVNRLWVKNRTGDGSTRLSGVSYAKLRELYSAEDTTTGDPLYYAILPNTRQIEVRPIPDYTSASGITFFHGFSPQPLARIYKPAITLSLTNGSTSGTFSSSISSVLMQAGDEIGVLETTQFDGTSIDSLNRVPMIYYGISAASGMSLTLDEAYEAATASGLSWVSAEVPDIDRLYPGIFGETLVNYAVSKFLEKDDKQAASYYMSLAMNDVVMFVPDEEDEEDIHPTYQNYPGFFGRR